MYTRLREVMRFDGGKRRCDGGLVAWWYVRGYVEVRGI